MDGCGTGQNTSRRRTTTRGSSRDFSPASISSMFRTPLTIGIVDRYGFPRSGCIWSWGRILSASLISTELVDGDRWLVWSSEIGAFEPLPCTVADVENVHFLV